MPSLTSSLSYKKWNRIEINSLSVSSGPRIRAHSYKLKAIVRLTLILVSLASLSCIRFSSGHALGPRVSSTAGKLKAQW